MIEAIRLGRLFFFVWGLCSVIFCFSKYNSDGFKNLIYIHNVKTPIKFVNYKIISWLKDLKIIVSFRILTMIVILINSTIKTFQNR